MPKNWITIRRARPDITDYLIHWTHGQSTDAGRLKPLDVLKEILQCGYLIPSYAPKASATVGGQNKTIKGDYPAVCFTEQPLNAFLKSCEVLPSRYNAYAVAVHKWHLFSYGGRPVIYGDESLLERLSEEEKYLWVRYSPIPEPTLGNYPIDWTHEREWRARQHAHHYPGIGDAPSEGVPLLLPPAAYPKSKKPVLALPRLIVRTRAKFDELKEWIGKLPPYDGTNGVLKYYFQVLPNAIIIPLDEVAARLKEGDARYSRLETLPYDEIDPSIKLPTTERYL